MSLLRESVQEEVKTSANGPDSDRICFADRRGKGECRRDLNRTLKSRLRTRLGPENKKKERPLRRSLLVNTGRDDWIRTSAPLLPNSLEEVIVSAAL